jgi:hypothetical protein
MVKYINYKGKKHPVKIGYYVLKMLKAETGKEITDVFQEGNTNLEIYEPLLFYALKKGAKDTDQEFAFKMEDMEDVLDDCLFDFIAMLPDFFPQLQQTDKKTRK